jgi:hypothetical protein
MSMKLPAPASTWTPTYQVRVNQVIEANDVQVRHKGEDVEIGAARDRLVLRSPSGKRWQITVSDTGTIAAVAL